LRQALRLFVDFGAAFLRDQFTGVAHLTPFAQVRRIDPVAP
jgi:hypothetical protein